MAINEKYSYKDFTGKGLTKVDPKELAGEIYGSCFHQHLPKTEVFPKGIDTVFVNCNLDNCIIPDGAEMKNCTNLMIKNFGDTEKLDPLDGLNLDVVLLSVVDDSGKKIDTLKNLSYILCDKKPFEPKVEK
jgi:hypothetical protein